MYKQLQIIWQTQEQTCVLPSSTYRQRYKFYIERMQEVGYIKQQIRIENMMIE